MTGIGPKQDFQTASCSPPHNTVCTIPDKLLLGHTVPDVRYQPYYCEENAWFLCQDHSPSHVVFVTNALRAVRMYNQRAAPTGVFWDYHVFVFADHQVWDFDTTLGFPVDFHDYVHRSFSTPTRGRLAPQKTVDLPDFRPLFRLVSSADYTRMFTSDRTHMLDPHGNYLKPPPPWPPIVTGTVPLADWLDLGNETLGRWVTLDVWTLLVQSPDPVVE